MGSPLPLLPRPSAPSRAGSRLWLFYRTLFHHSQAQCLPRWAPASTLCLPPGHPPRCTLRSLFHPTKPPHPAPRLASVLPNPAAQVASGLEKGRVSDTVQGRGLSRPQTSSSVPEEVSAPGASAFPGGSAQVPAGVAAALRRPAGHLPAWAWREFWGLVWAGPTGLGREWAWSGGRGGRGARRAVAAPARAAAATAWPTPTPAW